MSNLFDNLPPPGADEIFVELLGRPGIRIERIVSQGHVTPPDESYDQAGDEWVLLLSGGARIQLDGDAERELRPGDYLLIPAHRRHRVTWTTPDAPTIWLAIHVDPV